MQPSVHSPSIVPTGATEAMRFAVGFDPRDTARLHGMWDAILTSGRWTEGPFTEQFEAAWSAWNGLPAVATASWTGAAMAALAFAQVRGKTVLCPSNTFMATPLSVIHAGARVVFVDCNRSDLCMSYEDFVRNAELHSPAAAWVVHIGGHLAFDIEAIAAYCRDHGIWLLEDCAHAHGASWHGRKPGTWGDAGVYSFYATKTISTGEGGMLVTRHDRLAAFVRDYRNYGKPTYQVAGLNYRISEFAAAIGIVQTERLEDIVSWKEAYARQELDPRYPVRLRLPDGMRSGYYKYIVFEPIERSTGKVYDTPCHTLMGHHGAFPNAEWIAQHHWCVPLYYTPPLGLSG